MGSSMDCKNNPCCGDRLSCFGKPKPKFEAVAEIVEREWADRFGHHYEVTARQSSGPGFRQKVIKHGTNGWPKERERARAKVLRALAAKDETP